MKALTLHQPWATLIAVGAKRIETRSWGTGYRGPLAIHAGRDEPAAAARQLEAMWPFAARLEDALGASPELPRGRVVAVATLADVVRITAELAEWIQRRDEHEFIFGDYTPGRRAWRLEHVRRLSPEPAARGMPGLWEWTGPDAERAAAVYLADLEIPACRVCGCTENEACPGGCWWVPDPEMLGDLCSACEPIVAAAVPKAARDA